MRNKIAIYWDFENIHASVITVKYGSNWYRENRHNKQPQIVDIKSIMEFIRSNGDININKAFANWNSFDAYKFDLQDHSIDLIQMFPRGGHSKNGADIRMALDVIEDLSVYKQITTVVIIGGDSDYIPLAQKVRQKGCTIIGIGVKETTNQFLVKSCNEFKYYSSLLIKSSTIRNIENGGFEASDIEEARELLCKAITRIIDRSEDNYAKKAALKPMMILLDPSFDEMNFGFNNFSAFLESFDDIIEVTQGKHDHLVGFGKSYSTSIESSVTSEPSNNAHIYERILKKHQIRLIDGKLLKSGIYIAYSLFSEEGGFLSAKDFKASLYSKLKEQNEAILESDANKIYTILHKAFAFYFDSEESRTKLRPEIKSPEDLYDRAIKLLTKRILDHIDGNPSVDDFSRIILGDTSQNSVAQSYIDQYYRNVE